MSSSPAGFDPDQYKTNTRNQWDKSGGGYNAWGDTLRQATDPAMARLLAMAEVTGGARIMELAAGSGDQTLALARHVGSSGHVLATDISPGILAFAAENARAAGLNNVETQAMDGENLEVPEGSFDAVVSSLGLMFFPAPVASLQAQARAAKPGGKVGAVVIGEPPKNPFFSVPARVIMERAQLPPPAPGLPGPFALGAPGLLEGMFAEAGLTNIQCEPVSGLLKLSSVAEHIRFLADAFGALHMMMARMNDSEKQATWDAVKTALTPFDGPEGFRVPFEFIVCVGTRS